MGPPQVFIDNKWVVTGSSLTTKSIITGSSLMTFWWQTCCHFSHDRHFSHLSCQNVLGLSHASCQNFKESSHCWKFIATISEVLLVACFAAPPANFWMKWMKKSISFQCVSGGAAYSQVSVHITINHHTMHKHNTNQLSSPHSSQIDASEATQIGPLSHTDIILNALDCSAHCAQA